MKPAFALRLTPISIYRRIDSGELQATRLGPGPRAPTRISAEELARYVGGGARCCRTTQTPERYAFPGGPLVVSPYDSNAISVPFAAREPATPAEATRARTLTAAAAPTGMKNRILALRGADEDPFVWAGA